jgi:Transposase domain (DUF772)
MVMFRMLVLQSLYNLSDEQVEYQVRDRLSFTRFLGLGIEDGIPDGTTLWLFRFGQHLEAKGYIGLRGRGTVALDEIFALVGRAVLDGDAAAERGDPVDGAIGDRLGVIENPIFNPFNSPPSSDSRSI